MNTMSNVLKSLNGGNNYFVKVIGEYNNIGTQYVDNFNLFQRKEIEIPTPFKLIGHAERTNLSVEQKIYGQVKINPIQAKKVGLDNVIDGPMQYKNKSIIHDGELNVEKIQCIVDTKTFLKFKNENVKMEVIDNNTAINGKMVIIDLTQLSFDFSELKTFDDIVKNINELNELNGKLKVLNGLKSKVKKENINDINNIFDENQIELLKEHGLDKNLNYVGVDVVPDKKGEYMANVIEFKNYKKSPVSFNALLIKISKGQELNETEKEQYNFYVSMFQLTENMDDEQKDLLIKSMITNIKNRISEIKIDNVFIKLTMIDQDLLKTAPTIKGLSIIEKQKKFSK